MDHRILTLSLVLACGFRAASASAAEPAPVKVYVFSATASTVDAAAQSRQDAVKFVISRIEKFHKNTLAIAERGEALITIEVAAVDVVTTIDTDTTKNGSSTATKPARTAYHITAILRYRDAAIALFGHSGFKWLAAQQVAEDAEKWVKGHRATLAAQ
jgi:hypothetical protein